MLAVPPAILDQLDLKAGTTVALAVEGERLIVEVQRKPRYTLDELLAECDPNSQVSAEDRAWLEDAPLGCELL